MQKYIAHEGNSHRESVRITMFATCYDPETVQRMEKELIPYQLRNVLNGNRTISSSARNTGQTLEEMAELLVNQGLNWRQGGQKELQWPKQHIKWVPKMNLQQAIGMETEVIDMQRLGEIYAPTAVVRVRPKDKRVIQAMMNEPRNERVERVARR